MSRTGTTGNLLRFSPTLLALFCFAPGLRAQERSPIDPSWTAPESDDDEGATPDARSTAPSDATLPPPPAPPPALPSVPPRAPAPIPWVERDWPVRVQLRGDDPRLKFKIYSLERREDRKVPIFACANPCRVLLPRGEYRVRVSGGPEQVEGDRTVEVKAETSFHFSLPDRSERNSGLALGITGSALIPVGLMIAYFSVLSHAYCDSYEGHTCNNETPVGAYIGVGMMAVGAVLTPIGWVQFARSRKPRVEQRPLGGVQSQARGVHREARRPRIGIGAAPTPGGAAAGVWGSF